MNTSNSKKRSLSQSDNEITSKTKKRVSNRKCKHSGWFRVPPFGLDVLDKDNDIYKRICVKCKRPNWIGKWCPARCRLSETIVDPDDIDEDNV